MNDSRPTAQAGLDERLTEVEIRLSYQENGQETLHEVVLAQQKQIEQLQAELVTLKQRLQSYADALPDDERRPEPLPPHY